MTMVVAPSNNNVGIRMVALCTNGNLTPRSNTVGGGGMLTDGEERWISGFHLCLEREMHFWQSCAQCL